MKYFRNYPWGMQLLLFLLMTFTFLSCISVIVLSTFTKITGYDITAISDITTATPYGLVQAARVVQGVQNMFIFMLPAFTYAYLCHPTPARYLGLRRPGKSIQLLLSVTLMAGAMPIFMLIKSGMELIDFGAKLKTEQAQLDNMVQGMMNMPTVGSFIATFIIMAVVPGVGEELFFRGVLMRFAKKRSRSMVAPVLFSAVVFAYAHSNVYGFLSIFLAGVLLAVIYQLTGSLWCSILAHTLFNGGQVFLSYLANNNKAIEATMKTDSVPYGYAAAGAVVFAASLWLLLKNRTPLPANWTDDFTPRELAELKQERENRQL
ncbi:CPBP family intramembrane metalloprotease [Nemorincola caseinilytica]|uniref:CPBP family intramembrane metalloprotease n=1 Tax=Nemorincola caseinilytica TaxID=2054315 RepID=A0ABP8NF09_9BACT